MARGRHGHFAGVLARWSAGWAGSTLGVVTQTEWAGLLGRYGQHLHEAAGDVHHVVSPLGAWMVLALCAPLADGDPAFGRELEQLLGAAPSDAGQFAGGLLRRPHPLVAAGAGLWVRARVDNARVSGWRDRLPAQVDTGDIPAQDKLDRWASERTFGLIERFPLPVTPEVVCLLASALATKVSWEVPFEVADARQLGPSRWDATITRVLRTPPDPRHRQYLTRTRRAGPVAVHLAQARGGLLVGSVIAADESVPVGQVLAEAEGIVTAEASRAGGVQRLPIHELPLGRGPAWEIVEEPDGTGPAGHDERFTSVLPAWSADTRVQLTQAEQLGFGAAAAAIARALQLSDWVYDARQAAAAKYSAAGFQAAAATALEVALSAAIRPARVPRRAIVRFRHPYAVVAATCHDPRQPTPSAWHGLPVFSAWVAKADNAEATTDRGRGMSGQPQDRREPSPKDADLPDPRGRRPAHGCPPRRA